MDPGVDLLIGSCVPTHTILYLNGLIGLQPMSGKHHIYDNSNICDCDVSAFVSERCEHGSKGVYMRS